MQETRKLRLSNMIYMPYVGLGVNHLEDPETAVDDALWAHIGMIDTYREDGNRKAVGRGMIRSQISRYDMFVIARARQDAVEQGHIKEAIFDDFEELSTDYFDLYLLNQFPENYKKAWRDFSELYHEGWVKSVGVHNFTIDQILKLEDASDVSPAVNEILSNPYYPNQELIDACRKERVQILCASPFGGEGSGLLEEPVLEKLSRKYGKSPAQIVIRWNIQRGVASLVSTQNQKHMDEDQDVFDFHLSTADCRLINTLAKKE